LEWDGLWLTFPQLAGLIYLGRATRKRAANVVTIIDAIAKATNMRGT